MSCCPGLRCKNTGSGYVKPDGCSDSSRELEKRMQEMLAARSLQDAGIFKPVTTQPQENKKPVQSGSNFDKTFFTS
jgi:hypothetical protein